MGVDRQIEWIYVTLPTRKRKKERMLLIIGRLDDSERRQT